MAEGILLINWQDKMENSSVLFSSKSEKKSRTHWIRAILPAKTKKNIKVSSNG